MRGILLLTLLGAATTTAACASLDLHVDALDPLYLDTIDLRNQLFTQLQEALDPNNPTELLIERLKGEHRASFAEVEATYRGEADVLMARATSPEEKAQADALKYLASTLVEDFDKHLASLYDEFVEKIARIDAQIKTAAKEDPPQYADGLELDTGPLAPWLLKRRAELDGFFEERKAELLDKASEFEKGAKFELPAATRKIERRAEALDSLIGGQTLTEDKFAYAVASADDKYWAEDYNTTYGGGGFGDLNVAIKLQALADFSIKGFTFDPSGIAQIASKAAVQSVVLAGRIAAASFGIPSLPNIGGGESKDSGIALPDYGEANSQLWASEAKVESQRDALFIIAQRIITEQDEIERASSKNQQEAIKEVLQASFDAHRTRLILGDGQQNQTPPEEGEPSEQPP